MCKRLKIKVCGMRDADNMIAVSALKPDYMGFIFYSHSKRFVGPHPMLIGTGKEIRRTGVFVNETVGVMKDRIRQYDLDAVQLHGSETPETCVLLREKGVEVIKAFGIDEHFSFGDLNKYTDVCDLFLFDTRTEHHGGSGKAFNWHKLAQYQLQKSYFLSGGIGLENIAAINELTDERLYGVDLNSKFETEPGIKHIESLNTAFRKLRTEKL
ncbi:MAG TPA: phosphoribosylanthranilate isomerase [Sphingobacteriaceae bacterium]